MVNMSIDTVKKSFLVSFAITDRESCAKAIRNGGIAAMISAAISSAFGVAGFFTSSSNKDLNYVLDPWLLVDVALIVVLGMFIFRKSRIAAMLMVVYFAGSKLLMWAEIGEPKGLLMSLIFLLLYVIAMRATYIWHSKYREAAIRTAS
jgi:hypothetical protein